MLEELTNRLSDTKKITYRKLLTTVEDADQQKTFIDDVTARMKKSEEVCRVDCFFCVWLILHVP